MAEIMTPSSPQSRLNMPPHLEKYVVEQNYSRYTAEDQAVWRHILKQLTHFLSQHAHPCYLDGLEKTGITLDRIPRIEEISLKLEKFGWRAVAVSGFIPPAAFMEMQSLGILPIACDIRTKDHLLYTPAPDIVHEAAGHAPILVDPTFADYLRKYAEVARKAIVHKEDHDHYDAIRVLSDVKENPDSTQAEIVAAEERLEQTSKALREPSEAALLGRMNWWTAEYGLIGPMHDPKIFGAGLLSSIGESRSCLLPHVRKIPFSIDCLNFSYDITEPQPQLFVVDRFETLHRVLDEMASMMAFRKGGLTALSIAANAGTVTTVELDSGLQISGVLLSYFEDGHYLQFKGPTQISVAGRQLPGHGPDYHKDGYGTALGHLRWREVSSPSVHLGSGSQFSDWISARDLNREKLTLNSVYEIQFQSSVRIVGRLSGQSQFLKSFTQATVWGKSGELLFQPEWGTYDLCLGEKVVSAFGGPADRSQFHDSEDFSRRIVQPRTVSRKDQERFEIYHALSEHTAAAVRSERSGDDSLLTPNQQKEALELITRALSESDWLLLTEALNCVLSLAKIVNDSELSAALAATEVQIRTQLTSVGLSHESSRAHIEDAIRDLSEPSA